MRCKKYTVPSYLFNQFNPKSEQNYYERFTFFLLSDARRGNLSAVIPLVSLRRGSVVNMLNHFSKYVKALQFDVYQNFDKKKSIFSISSFFMTLVSRAFDR